jgi:hypothetical protein
MAYPRVRRQSTKSRGVLEPKRFDRGPFRAWYSYIFSLLTALSLMGLPGQGHILGRFYSIVLLLDRTRSRSV